jgi:hypothetical protein
VGEGSSLLCWRIETDPFKQGYRLRCALLAREVVVNSEHLANLLTDSHQRVQARHWFLKDHGDPIAA